MEHFPKGARYSALEKNELKARAFEMVLHLFYIERLRGFVVESVRATTRLRGRGSPDAAIPSAKEAWQILVDDGIITAEEHAEVRKLIDYRNVIAHATARVTLDLNRMWAADHHCSEELSCYQPDALRRLEYYVGEIPSRMQSRYILSLSLEDSMFEPTARTYKEELERLRQKVQKQLLGLKEEIATVNENISALPPELLPRLEVGHPRNWARTGQLSPRGVEVCYALFHAGATPLSVAYLMRMSLRSVYSRFVAWKPPSLAPPSSTG